MEELPPLTKSAVKENLANLATRAHSKALFVLKSNDHPEVYSLLDGQTLALTFAVALSDPKKPYYRLMQNLFKCSSLEDLHVPCHLCIPHEGVENSTIVTFFAAESKLQKQRPVSKDDEELATIKFVERARVLLKNDSCDSIVKFLNELNYPIEYSNSKKDGSILIACGRIFDYFEQETISIDQRDEELENIFLWLQKFSGSHFKSSAFKFITELDAPSVVELYRTMQSAIPSTSMFDKTFGNDMFCKLLESFVPTEILDELANQQVLQFLPLSVFKFLYDKYDKLPFRSSFDGQSRDVEINGTTWSIRQKPSPANLKNYRSWQNCAFYLATQLYALSKADKEPTPEKIYQCLHEIIGDALFIEFVGSDANTKPFAESVLQNVQNNSSKKMRRNASKYYYFFPFSCCLLTGSTKDNRCLSCWKRKRRGR